MMIQRLIKKTRKYLLILFLLSLTCILYIEYNILTKDKSSSEKINNEKNKTRYRLIILILSSPKNEPQRDAIRTTWLSKNRKDVKHLFAIGSLSSSQFEKENLEIEEEKNKDILLLKNLSDSYQTLTKKVLQSFSTVYENFDFNYLLKCDDDTFVLVDKLLTELNEWEFRSNGQELYWGFFNGRAQVKKTGSWKENDWIFCDFYLPYALGGGYVLSHRLVQFIAQNSNILRIQNAEDVSVGLWLSPLSDIERKHDVRFDTEYQSRGCSNDYIVTHKQSIESMNSIYETYENSHALCVKEVRLRQSYQYDWTAPPSKCCERQPGIP